MQSERTYLSQLSHVRQQSEGQLREHYAAKFYHFNASNWLAPEAHIHTQPNPNCWAVRWPDRESRVREAASRLQPGFEESVTEADGMTALVFENELDAKSLFRELCNRAPSRRLSLDAYYQNGDNLMWIRRLE